MKPGVVFPSQRALVTAAAIAAFTISAARPAAGSPVTIIQNFGQALSPLSVNGAPQLVAGDWIVTIVTDTGNADINPDPAFGTFAVLESATLTNSGLGLVNAPIDDIPYYYFEFESPSGFQSAGFVTNFSVLFLNGPSGAIGDPNIIEPAFLEFAAASGQLGFDNFHVGTFGIRGGTATTGGSQTFIRSTAVPEPATLSLMLVALSARALCRRRRA